MGVAGRLLLSATMRRKMHQWKMSLLIVSLLLWRTVTSILTDYDLNPPVIHYDLMNPEIWTCGISSERVVQSLEDARRVHIISTNKSSIAFVSTAGDIAVNYTAHSAGCTVSQTGLPGTSFSEINYDEHQHHRKKRAAKDLTWFESYHNRSDIYEWFQLLSQEHPSKIEVTTIGRTYSDREIIAVKISDGASTTNSHEKPKIYLQCLLHAREWITGPMCMYIAHRLVVHMRTEAQTSSHGSDDNILAKVDVVMVPIANPDGYELTWVDYPKYRLWRKNLSKQSKDTSECAGVDLNRNFDIKWGLYGSSKDQCSEIYQGPSSSSEQETKAITQLLKGLKPLIGALDFHSYSQVILYPSGWTKSPTVGNIDKMRTIAETMADTASEHGAKYTSQQMGSIYLASGTFADWVHEDNDLEHPLPLTVELCPSDSEVSSFPIGFMVQPNKILPTCKGMFDAVIKYILLMLETDKSKM